MSQEPLWRVRPAVAVDLPSLLDLARLAGGGFTNLPPDETELARRIALSEQSLAQAVSEPDDELYLLILEDARTGIVAGTASLFSKLGTQWPWYSYKVAQVAQVSKELGKTLRSDVLYLVNEFDGWSEVGGLFLDARWRGSGAGRVMARARYLFIARHRRRFARQVLADLRGYQTPDGASPFWDGLGRHFFDMPFEAADRFNSLTGNQFIADLMPKYPIYVRLLPAAAQAAIGQPHPLGQPAVKLLEEEGFDYHRYIDIFDGGPTMTARIDSLKAVREARATPLGAPADPAAGGDRLICAGEAAGFRLVRGTMRVEAGRLHLDEAAQAALGVASGDEVWHAPF